MEACSLQFITAACGGELLNGSLDAQVQRACTDSRQVQPGDLFFALRGERFDGHDYTEQVAAKGVAAVVVQRGHFEHKSLGCAIVAVDDPRKALGQVAARYRGLFELPIVAVGGSNGKTTTKELIAAVLKQERQTLWSEASFNNDIGVPMTLLRMDKAHQAAVLEVGTNHPGELAPLVQMIRPNHGVITSVGREHLEFFEDIEGVAREEGWLAELIPSGGKLFVNGDDQWTSRLVDRARAQVVRVGLEGQNDWRALGVRVDTQGVRFRVAAPAPDFSGDYRIHLLGRHQVVNALFAIAVGRELGLSREAVARGLEECRPAKMRLELQQVGGFRVLDDAYNANADSMVAALRTLRDLPCRGRRVAVLGDMAELGAHAESAHEEVGRQAAELGVGQLFAVGQMAPVIARAARSAGLNRVLEFADVIAAAAAVKSFVKAGDLVLVKASRAMRLERVVEFLRGSEAGRQN